MPADRSGEPPLPLPPLGQTLSSRHKGFRLFQAFANTDHFAVFVEDTIHSAFLAKKLDCHFGDGHFFAFGLLLRWAYCAS